VLLRLVDVSKRFGSRWALSHVSLELDRPGTVLLTGENGAGKTTLLKVIATAQRPTLGSIELFGASVGENLGSVRSRIAVMTHQAHLYFDLTARENLALAARLTNRPLEQIDALLQRVGLGEDSHRPVGRFSAGMKRRVTLARLLLLEPQIALLDEPFTQLDPDGVTLMSNVIRELEARGCLTIVATHDIERGRELAQAHLTMDDGRAVSLEELR
jgi:heme ABC exporter ATP-binding subunit CcmA